MPLRKSPLCTPAALAARRANACKSHGPKTVRGKARASLNALKHGRYAVDLRQKLIDARDRQGEALYARIEARVAEAFCSSTSSWVPTSAPRSAVAEGTTVVRVSPSPEGVTPAQAGVQGQSGWVPASAGTTLEKTPVRSKEDERQLRRLTSLVWCFAARRPQKPPHPKTILECAMESVGCASRDLPRTRIQVHDGHRRVGLVFWVQRRRIPGWNTFWKRFGKDFERAVAGLDNAAFGQSGSEQADRQRAASAALKGASTAQMAASTAVRAAGEWEIGLRSRIFRLGRPNIWDRIRYGLYRDGTYSPELEVQGWRELKKLCLAGIPVNSSPPLLGGSPGNGQGESIGWALLPLGFGKKPATAATR